MNHQNLNYNKEDERKAEQAIYQRLAPFIQDYIYSHRWSRLTPLQVMAAEAIFQGEEDLILMAGTAQGKTEAAFLPAITVIAQESKASPLPLILYISPLKALINDQFSRIEDMLKDSDIPLTKWHGDASPAQKEGLLRHPGGILQTTPESLEAMICLHPERIDTLFANLRFVIIDEIHAFMASERGLQLLLLLERIQNRTGCQPLRIGLSATIQNKEQALHFIGMGSCRSGRIITHREKGRQASVAMTASRISQSRNELQKKGVENNKKVNPLLLEFPDRYIKKLWKQSQGKRALLFTSSRKNAEILISRIRAMALENHQADIYYIHHGSISKDIRELTETAMKNTEGPILTATTLTLELGIDIGDLDEVILACDPPSISSMVQRLGRSGRRNGRSVLSFHLRHQEDRGQMDQLDLSLVRSMAMTELYFRECYLEDMQPARRPYHLLVHTILSLLCEQGCLQPPQLARQTLELSLFRFISQDDFRDLLWALIDKNVLTLYDDGAIGLNDRGEAIVNSMNFYAVFQGEETMTVFHDKEEIGSITRPYRPGDCFFLAGRAWEVTERDLTHHRLLVKEKEMTDEDDIRFAFDGWGEKQNDRRMMEKIHEILLESADDSDASVNSDTKDNSDAGETSAPAKDRYPYLDAEAQGILEEIREKIHRYGLDQECKVVNGEIYLCPALGSRTLLTIYHILSAQGLDCHCIYLRDLLYGIRVRGIGRKALVQICQKLSQEKHLLDHGYVNSRIPCFGKYYNLLPPQLRAQEIISDQLDMEGAREFLTQLY